MTWKGEATDEPTGDRRKSSDMYEDILYLDEVLRQRSGVSRKSAQIAKHWFVNGVASCLLFKIEHFGASI